MNKSLILNENERTLRELLLDVAEFISTKEGCRKPVLRFAGGWVRDKLLGSTSHDIDVGIDNMTGYRFGKLMEQFLEQNAHAKYPNNVKLAKIEANPEKSKHLETATTTILGLEIDLVNLRKETYANDNRNPTMEFGSPEEDALRRDATINAMFYNLSSSEVEDLTGRGFQDLEHKMIKTPLPPFQTFMDDPLRVLRAIRFASRLGFEINDDDKQAMSDESIKKALKAKITRERVGAEVLKMLRGPNPQIALSLLDHVGLYNTVFTTTEYGAVEVRKWSKAYDKLSEISNMSNVQGHENSSKIINRLLIRDANDLYLAWIVACFVPWAGRIAKVAISPTGKRLPCPASLAAKEGIKAENKISKLVDDAVLHLHDVIVQKSEAAQDDSLASPLKRKSYCVRRVAHGLAIRRWGPQWRSFVMFGLLTECSEADNPEDTERLLDQYANFLRHVEDLGLLDSDKLKPILGGDKIAAIFPKREKGPWMKKAIDIAIEWQLQNPGCENTDEAIEDIRRRSRELFPWM